VDALQRHSRADANRVFAADRIARDFMNHGDVKLPASDGPEYNAEWLKLARRTSLDTQHGRTYTPDPATHEILGPLPELSEPAAMHRKVAKLREGPVGGNGLTG
jgi:hypothetical protein